MQCTSPYAGVFGHLMNSRSRKLFHERGFSLIETLATFTILSIIMGIASYNFSASQDAAGNGANELIGLLKRARAKGLNSTLSYTLTPASSKNIIAKYSATCADAVKTTDPDLQLRLPGTAQLVATNWSVCYNTRGLSTSSLNILVRDNYRTKTVEVALGGGVRVQ